MWKFIGWTIVAVIVFSLTAATLSRMGSDENSGAAGIETPAPASDAFAPDKKSYDWSKAEIKNFKLQYLGTAPVGCVINEIEFMVTAEQFFYGNTAQDIEIRQTAVMVGVSACGGELPNLPGNELGDAWSESS